MIEEGQCPICGQSNWEDLPNPSEFISVTTDGSTIHEPLNKHHCLRCGLVKRRKSLPSGAESFYEMYQFYDRPDMRSLNDSRYQSYAEWVAKGIERINDGFKILEIGCGQGWVLKNLMNMYTDVTLAGLEPSRDAVSRACSDGLDVIEGFAGTAWPERQNFDLVYSINVIEHSENPLHFLKDCSKYLTSAGKLMVVCPNAFFIDTEVLFSDHLYSMTQEHVEALADNAGLRFVRCIEAPDGLEIFQGLVFELESRFSAKSNKARSNCERMVKERKSYLDSWVKLDNALARRTEGYKNIWCFGAGETMDLLRTYAPSTWTKVRGVTMDASQENTINGLPLIPINQIDEQECDCLLLGTRPGSHAKLKSRFSNGAFKTIRWDDIIPASFDVREKIDPLPN